MEQIFFFLAPFFLFFPFQREISSTSWNVDKSVKVSLNLKSVSNQIRRCNNIQGVRGERERESGNFHDETVIRKNNILTRGREGPLLSRPFSARLSIVVAGALDTTPWNCATRRVKSRSKIRGGREGRDSEKKRRGEGARKMERMAGGGGVKRRREKRR